MRRTNQGGSLAGFIIIGVLLTLVLVGGLYGLNRYNAQRTADETARTESSEATDDETAPKEESSGDAAKTDPKSTDTSTQSRTDRSGAGNAQQTPAQSSTQPNRSGSQPARSGQLPATGPGDTLLGLMVVTVLTFAGVHYARSRA